MPAKHYTHRLTLEEVLGLVESGKYRVDLEEGTISNAKMGKPLFTHSSGRSPNRWVRVYRTPKFRALPVAWLVWMVGTGETVPKGWEVHHRDGNNQNNSFANLLCVHPVDHRKLHAKEYEQEPIPF